MAAPQRCEIVGDAPGYQDLVTVQVPGIYPRGEFLPARLARLYRPAAIALDAALVEISAAGGHLYLSDMFRSTLDQERAHQDYLTGKKSAYSPPAGGSMHEAGRALDLDIGDTGIGLKAVKAILAKHGWTGIAERGSECWHHDYRDRDGQSAYDHDAPGGMSAYRTMARFCIGVISPHLPPVDQRPSVQARDSAIVAVQRLLGLKADGIYGPATRDAVKRFQASHLLVVDGIAGPITLAAMRAGK